jgi:ABC-type Mn2+/Zn2+ transport system ATPase subunit
MNKEEFLVELDEIIEEEDQAVIAYIRQIETVLPLSCLEIGDMTRIKTILNIQKEESTKHREAFRALKERVAKGEFNVF